MNNLGLSGAPRRVITPAPILTLVGAALLLAAAPGRALALSVTANHDVLAGHANFVNGIDTEAQFDWDTVSVTNGSTTASVALGDGTVNTVNAVLGGSFAIRNWVDAPGFDGVDLALNGVETFDVNFGKAHKSLGFAVITGLSQPFPSEVSDIGAAFTIAVYAQALLLGTETVTLAPGDYDQAWITILSDVAFTRVEIREIGTATVHDQYFSDVLTAVEKTTPATAVVPEPTALALALAGVAAAARRGRAPRFR